MFQRLAGSLSFAHLAGLNRAKAKKADDDADKPGCDDDEENSEAAAEQPAADAEEDGKKGKKGKKSGSHEENDDDPSDEDEDDEDDPGEDKMKKARKEGRKAERARCGKIFASEAAGKNVALAAKLAFNTGMSAEAAIALLESMPVNGSLAQRMDTARAPKVGPGTDQGGGGGDQTAIASSWDRATKPYVKTR